MKKLLLIICLLFSVGSYASTTPLKETTMTVNEWFADGCNYDAGLEIYKALPNANKHLLKALSSSKTKPSLMKLKYELQKHLAPTISKPKSIYKPQEKFYRKVLIRDLPVELHSYYLKQKSDYTKACSLKIQLNNLEPHEIPHKSLPLVLELDKLLTNVDKTWQIIDYYQQHKQLPTLKEISFDQLTAVELLNKRNSVRSSITRQNKRLEKLTQQAKETAVLKYKKKFERDIIRCNNKLMQLNQDLIQLNELIS